MPRAYRNAILFTMFAMGALIMTPGARAQDAPLPAQPTPIQPGASDGAGPASSSGPGAPTAPPPPPSFVPPPPPPGIYIPGPPPTREVITYESVGVWFSADYLLWWIKSNQIPALVTAGVPPDAGVLGPATTQTLFGGGDISMDTRSGGRFIFGFWLQDTHVVGLEGAYFFLGDHSAPIASGDETSNPPGTPPGSFFASVSTFLQSAEANAVVNLVNSPCFRLEFLGGFRYMELHETLHVQQDFTSADLTEQDTWDDLFHTRNHFYGGQLGLRGEYNLGRWFVDMTGKVALGVTDQKVSINGGLTQGFFSQGLDAFGNVVQNVQVAQDAAGGLLAAPATFHRDRFAVIPEVGVNLGYQFTSYFRASFGYSFIYWSSVVRPGDQVTGVPKATDFWTQGVNLGLTFTF